jgi:hypothetical protein
MHAMASICTDSGAGDTAVPPVNATFLYERLPHSKLDVIDAGYFTWEPARLAGKAKR